jgi:hypothetical protein
MHTYRIPHHNNCLFDEEVVAVGLSPPPDDNVPITNEAGEACEPEPAILCCYTHRLIHFADLSILRCWYPAPRPEHDPTSLR